MLKVFVLILYASGNGKTLATHEFNSEAACNSARDAAIAEFKVTMNAVKGICVPKG